MNKEKWLEYIKSIVYALFIAFIFRSFTFEAYKIPSSSMEPTLLISDRLFISKYSYGYSKYSFMPGIPLFDDLMEALASKFIKNRVFATTPKRGDVIVFRGPKNDRKSYIKRLIGLPGDTVIIFNNDIYINGQKTHTEISDEYSFFNEGSPILLQTYKEFLSEATPHTIAYVLRNTNANLVGATKFEVPQGHYFMMGDNRDFSNDSRFDIGMVPEENLIGKAEFRFWTGNVISDIFSLKIDKRWLAAVE